MLEYNFRKRRLIIPKKGAPLTIKGRECRVKPLCADDAYVGMNINSWVVKAIENGGNEDDKEDCFAIKICSFPLDADRDIDKVKARVKRFEREISAMRLANEGQKQECVLNIYEDFEIEVQHLFPDGNAKVHRHLAFCMELADHDLGSFLKNDISFDSRVVLCFDILRNLKWLHDKDIYHRDIKPANFFMVDNKCKIGDLGLVRLRNDDLLSVDEPTERIGPIAFLTPEAINKAYSMGRNRSWSVGEKSDVHQVAKLIWFILQYDIPNGIVQSSDVDIKSDTAMHLFGNIYKPAMQYGEDRRPSIERLCADFGRVMKGYL